MSETDENTEANTSKKQRLQNDDEETRKNIDDTKFSLFNMDLSNYERLKEFKVLDEADGQEDDSDGDDSDSSDDKSEEIPDEDIEKMLEEDLPDEYKRAPKPKEKPYVSREKVVLDEKGMNDFEILPLDWSVVRHYSGMPVYLHRSTGVCTLSKPYSIGKGNARNHEIPITAIPCFAYRRAIEEEEKQKEIDRKIEEQISSGTWNQTSKDSHSDGHNKVNTDNANDEVNDHDIITVYAKETDGSYNNEKYPKQFTQKFNIMKKNVTNNDPPTCPFSKNKAQDDDTSEASTSQAATLQDVGIQNDNNNENKTNDESKSSLPLNVQPVVLPGGIIMAPPKVETASTTWKTQLLTPEQVNEYCKKLFFFKTVNIRLFKKWADRRKYNKARKTLHYPTLLEGTKRITIPIPSSAGNEHAGDKPMKREWVMNMDGRSYLSVFHEYAHRALHKQPIYEFDLLENSSKPYQARVLIGGMQYGVGTGTSKRQAKSAAARASMNILIPEMRDTFAENPPTAAASSSSSNAATSIHLDPEFSFFDNVGIKDPRVAEFCAATCEPSPHAILRTCLLRNFGEGHQPIITDVKNLENQKVELTMKVGKHTSTVTCKNKKTAKQRAAQAILQALHPQVESWGSLLRLYGLRSVKSRKEKKMEEQQITLLQDKARVNEPNYAVLDKLRAEMRKLRDREKSVNPIGSMHMMGDLPTHSSSNLNNIDL